MRYVIIGAGPAGVIAAETLARIDPAGDVLVIGDEPEPPYSRMAIPYLLSGKIEEDGTYLRKAVAHYDNAGIAIRRATVASVSPKDGRLTLTDGAAVPFDRLLVATGASAANPPVAGLDGDGIRHCWTMADARAIAERARSGADVVLMGAGFIGCIIMEALVRRGVNLTVVEMEDRMLPRMMDSRGGALIKSWCEGKGVRVLTSARVTAVESAGGGRNRVVLERGEPLEADLVVVATGVRSNTGFLEGSGVKVENGVVVDEHLRSSADTVYAAGDVAQGPDFSTGGWMVHAIQPTAVEHGRIAALNMAGRDAVYKGSLIMNVLDTVGLISASFGAWQGVDGGETAEVVNEDSYRYLRLSFAEDRLVGALSLGLTQHVGVLRGLIQTRVALGGWKDRLMDDPHRVMEAYLACTQG